MALGQIDVVARSRAGALVVLSLFLFSGWHMSSGLGEVTRADARALAAESVRADLNRLAALENAAEAGEDLAAADVDAALVAVRAHVEELLPAVPSVERTDFAGDIEAYAKVSAQTAFAFLAGELDSAEDLDDEVTDPLYAELVAELDVLRARALAVSDAARRDAHRGLLVGGIGVLVGGGLLIWLVAHRHGRFAARVATEASEMRFRSLLEDATDHCYLIKQDGQIEYMSPSAVRYLGASFATVDELVMAVGRHLPRAVRELTTPGGPDTIEVSVTIGDRVGWFELAARDRSDSPEIGGLVVTAHDITAQAALREQLSAQATTDDLTGLANRRALRTQLTGAVARAGRGGAGVAVALIDLDGFKGVNDTLGHPVGDELLRQVASRLERVTRAGETIGRLGGDEFAVVAEHVGGADEVLAVADRLLTVFDTPFVVDDQLLSVRASIGAVLGEGDAEVESLFRRADIALYEAKRGGRNRAVQYDAAMEDGLLLRNRLENELEPGMERGEFHLVYQPIVDAAADRIVGFEALMRWRSPNLGDVPPLTFIPIAEQSGLILSLGRWALVEACQQLGAWQQVTRNPALTMSVNASVVQLQHRSFVDDVCHALVVSGIDAACLQIEVTESVVVSDGRSVVACLTALRERGVRVALDDFGTGYSSLNQLRRLPVDCLKIDRSFVSSLAADNECSLRLVEAMIDLARAFGLAVVAEGVEESQQLELLRAAGIDRFQGYLLGRPAPPSGILARLTSAPPTRHGASPDRERSGAGRATSEPSASAQP